MQPLENLLAVRAPSIRPRRPTSEASGKFVTPEFKVRMLVIVHFVK
jgi:hypothetical protein